MGDAPSHSAASEGAATHPRDQLLVLQHRLHPLLELDLLLILRLLRNVRLLVLLVLVHLERAEQDGRSEPGLSIASGN